MDRCGVAEHLQPDWPLEREYPLQSHLLVTGLLNRQLT